MLLFKNKEEWCTKAEEDCHSSSPPLVDIVRFGPLGIAVSLTVLKHVY